MMKSLTTRLFALARWGLCPALAALGLALVVSAWMNRREAERLSVVLDRAQAERFFRPIPPLHDRNRGPATEAQLSQLLGQFRAEGLRYVAEVAPDGSVLAAAGEPTGVAGAAATTEPVVIGDRVRVVFRPPRGAGGSRHGAPTPASAEAPSDTALGADMRPSESSPHPFPLPDLLLEFEPTVSNQLRERARDAFVFSLTAASALLALTLGLWLSLRREASQRERRERERQLAALGQMSAVLAHEIRNPLASLKGTAQLLAEQLEASSPLQKKVTRIVGEAKRLEDLSSTLLDLVRSSSVEPKPVDPRKLVRDIARTIAADRVVVDASAAPELWSLDPLRFEQVLKNLLQNALQASPVSVPPVEVWVGVELGKLAVRVRDHGEGLSAGSEQKIFQAFYTTRAHGTGLGLAVARRIVELHGGQLTASNHPDGGAVFNLLIP